MPLPCVRASVRLTWEKKKERRIKSQPDPSLHSLRLQLHFLLIQTVLLPLHPHLLILLVLVLLTALRGSRHSPCPSDRQRRTHTRRLSSRKRPSRQHPKQPLRGADEVQDICVGRLIAAFLEESGDLVESAPDWGEGLAGWWVGGGEHC
jgi:hypothetical protein